MQLRIICSHSASTSGLYVFVISQIKYEYSTSIADSACVRACSLLLKQQHSYLISDASYLPSGAQTYWATVMRLSTDVIGI